MFILGFLHLVYDLSQLKSLVTLYHSLQYLRSITTVATFHASSSVDYSN